MEEEEEELEVKFLDQEQYYNSTLNAEVFGDLVVHWPKDFQRKEKKWHKKLEKAHEKLVDNRHICLRIILEHMKALNYSAIQTFLFRWNQPVDLNYLALREEKRAFNLPMILRRYAELMDADNFIFYINTVLGMRAIDRTATEDPNQTISILRMRLTDLELFHWNYWPGIEKHLASCQLLRFFRHPKQTKNRKNISFIQSTRKEFALTAHETMMALQAILGDWKTQIQSEKIVQITHANTLQLRVVKMKTDSLAVLNESLICAIALDREEAQEEMEEMDAILSGKTKERGAKQRWGHWKTISNMVRNRRNPNGCLIHAQRLEEEAQVAGDECAVLVETACRARAKCEEQNERIIEVITETIQRCPSLGPRMIQLAQECNVGYETDQMLQTLSDTGRLHPSEPLWLTIVEKQITAIGRYQSIETTLKTSLKIMFEFLDFDSNRFDEKAWKLLKKALECTEPSFVAAEWKNRKSWWSRYQRTTCRNGRRMSEEAEAVKEEVLQALDEYIC